MRAPATLVIDFHFDLICPWCLIGKRHLDAALAALHAELPQLAIELRWHGHELLPDLPPGGVPYQAFYERRLGGAAAVTARRAQVQAAAQQAGLVLAFERIRTMPNTRLAHCLLDCVRRHGTPAQLAALIDALFVDPAVHGRGYGTVLLEHALSLAPDAVVDASEQASNALAFYEARGFVRTGRSESDPQGRPYPLIHLKYGGADRRRSLGGATRRSARNQGDQKGSA